MIQCFCKNVKGGLSFSGDMVKNVCPDKVFS